MTLLELLQAFSSSVGLPVPQIVVASQDESVMQLQEILNEVLEDLTLEPWTILDKEAVFLQIAAEDQGPMTTLAPFGFQGMIHRTFYDRTQKLEVFGPKNEAEWQLLKAVPMTGPYLQWRIARGHLLLNGVYNEGHTMAFEYHSNYSVLAADGVTWKRYFSADTDTCVFDEALLKAGLKWKWKSEKGLRYSEDFRRYELLKANLKGREGSQRTISMSGEGNGFSPGVFVPQASWNIQ